jgi:hypothetical protein
MRRVEPEMGIGLITERTRAQGLDDGIERSTHAADLTLRQRGDAEGLHEVLYPTGADALHMGFLPHHKQGPLGTATGLEHAGEQTAVTDPWVGQLDAADPGVPAEFAKPPIL